MTIVQDKDFFKILKNKQSLTIEIEDRKKLGYNTHGMNNHGEFLNYMNPHDNCLWDAIIPGYKKSLKAGTKYKTDSIIGIYYLENGNHKIAIKINENGYDKNKSRRDLQRYIKNYKKNIPVKGEWIGLSKYI